MRPEAEIDFTPGTVNGAILFDTDAAGYESFTAQVWGTFVATVTFEQSNDRVTWHAVSGMAANANGTANPLVTTATGGNILTFPVLARFVRARVSAFTSGTINGRAYMRNAPFMPVQAQYIAGSVNQPTEARASATAPGNTSSRPGQAATTNATLLKSTAGNILDIFLFNTGATIRYLKIYNLTTTPVPGTSTPFLVIPLPPGVLIDINPQYPIRCGTGIGYAITAGLADNDATAIAAGEIQGFINWV